jgi:hypothetical protein
LKAGALMEVDEKELLQCFVRGDPPKATKISFFLLTFYGIRVQFLSNPEDEKALIEDDFR